MTQTPWRFPVSVESDQLAALVHQAGVLEETYGHRLSAWQAPSEEVAESVELLFELLFNSSAGTVVRYS